MGVAGGQATHQARIALCVHHAVARAQRVGAVEEDPLAALGPRLAQDHCSGQVWVIRPPGMKDQASQTRGWYQARGSVKLGAVLMCVRREASIIMERRVAHRTRERSTLWRRLPLRWPSAARVPARSGRPDGWIGGWEVKVGRAGQGRARAGSAT